MDPTKETIASSPQSDSAPLNAVSEELDDFSFVEVSPEDGVLIETGGSCCSCS
jgi:hypothetical protein